MKEATRDTQVSEEMKELSAIFVDIEKSIETLSTRLVSILMPEAVEETTDEKTVVPIVPLAAELRCMNNQFRDLLTKLNSLRGRIEL